MTRIIDDVDWENMPKERVGPAKILTEAVQFVKDHNTSEHYKDGDAFSGQEVTDLLMKTMQHWFQFLRHGSERSPDADLCYLVTTMLCFAHKMMDDMNKADRKRCKQVLKMAKSAGLVNLKL